MRFCGARLVERIVEVQQELCRSDLQCYMLGLRGQDVVREQVGMSNFAIVRNEESQEMEFIAKAEFVERADLFNFIEAQLGTSFLKGRPALPREQWYMLFDKMPTSWADFLRQVLKLVELAILDAARSSKRDSKGPSEVLAEASENTPSLNDEDILAMFQEVTVVSKTAKRRARKKRQPVGNAKDEEDASMVGEAVTESVTEASSITAAESVMDSSGSTRVPLQSISASAGVEDDTMSVSTMDIAMNLPKVVEDEELQVDWSSAEPVNPVTPLVPVQEEVELEVDWNRYEEQPEETRWSASMVDALTGVQAQWHWVTTPSPVLTCGNLRAHIKNTFVHGIENLSEVPEEIRRAKSAPAPTRRKRTL